MKLFIDSADLAQIERLARLGVVDGVTTNPSLVAKLADTPTASDLHSHYRRICETVKGDVSAEVIGTVFDDIVEEARVLAKIDSRIVVKVPMLPDGVRAIRALKEEGIRTNCTLIFSAAQALLAAKAGAAYVSPFIGRLDDAGECGTDLVHQIAAIFAQADFDAQVLAASIRNPLHVVQCAEAGADVASCPPAVFDAMFKHPLTDAGLEKFLADYEKIKP